MRAAANGALIYGVDVSTANAAGRFSAAGLGAQLVQTKIEEFIKLENGQYDVAFCFSVLPYLKDAQAVLGWMADHTRKAFIELQYPPEPYTVEGITGDKEMKEVLRMFWRNAEPIGRTYVRIRDLYRTVWMVQ